MEIKVEFRHEDKKYVANALIEDGRISELYISRPNGPVGHQSPELRAAAREQVWYVFNSVTDGKGKLNA